MKNKKLIDIDTILFWIVLKLITFFASLVYLLVVVLPESITKLAKRVRG